MGQICVERVKFVVFYGPFGVEGDLMLLGTTEFLAKAYRNMFLIFRWDGREYVAIETL